MDRKIKVGAVNYLNTKPLLYGIENNASLKTSMDLSVEYPALLAQLLKQDLLDIALLPVAAIPEIEGARIVSNYGIATDGDVVSVALFSQVPIEQIEQVYLDYQSRTSVQLAQILLKEYWNKELQYLDATPDYIFDIKGTTAGVIIGDRALKHLPDFKYVYDLGSAWKAHTGLPFVFAAWVANKDLPQSFLNTFDEANALGLTVLEQIAMNNEVPYYDLKKYYQTDLSYLLDANKKKGLNLFLEKIGTHIKF